MVVEPIEMSHLHAFVLAIESGHHGLQFSIKADCFFLGRPSVKVLDSFCVDFMLQLSSAADNFESTWLAEHYLI